MGYCDRILERRALPKERPPIELEPCQLDEWLQTHNCDLEGWQDGLVPNDLRVLFSRHAESSCPVAFVIRGIASNPATPPDVLEALAGPGWRDFRSALLENPNLPAESLRRMARLRRVDPSTSWLLRQVASHRNTPIDVVRRLAEHRRPYEVRETAKLALLRREVDPERLDPDEKWELPEEEVPLEMDPCLLKEWVETHNWKAFELDEAMTAEEIRSLYRRHVDSGCPVAMVLSEMTDLPNTPVDILVELADPRWRGEVHLGLALHPNVPAEYLIRLASRGSLTVREHALWNPSLPIEQLEKWATRSRSEFIREIAAEALEYRRK